MPIRITPRGASYLARLPAAESARVQTLCQIEVFAGVPDQVDGRVTAGRSIRPVKLAVGPAAAAAGT
jgi:hypothetical protein